MTPQPCVTIQHHQHSPPQPAMAAQHGALRNWLPACEAARWLGPSPAGSSIMTVPSYLSCPLGHQEAPLLSSPAATASATTSPLGALSLLLLMRLPSGTRMAFTQPPADRAPANTRKPHPATHDDTSTNSKPYLHQAIHTHMHPYKLCTNGAGVIAQLQLHHRRHNPKPQLCQKQRQRPDQLLSTHV